MRRSEERGFGGIRLVQAGYHSRTLALYLKLGFEAREQLACIQGPAVGKAVAGHVVRLPPRVILRPATDFACAYTGMSEAANWRMRSPREPPASWRAPGVSQATRLVWHFSATRSESRTMT